MNKVILMGRLGDDAELKIMANGDPLMNFRLATSEKYKDKDDKLVESTQWHRCSMWGKRAESLSQYLTKGKQILVEGQINYRESEKDGVKRYYTDIKVFNVEFAGDGKKGDSNPSPKDDKTGNDDGFGGDDDIPF